MSMSISTTSFQPTVPADKQFVKDAAINMRLVILNTVIHSAFGIGGHTLVVDVLMLLA